MSAFTKLIDAILLFFFVVIAVAVPLIAGQMVLPPSFYPEFLIGIKSWYSREFDHYLVKEEPNFYLGLAWLELFFQWPLALLNLYALATSKHWFNTTCLIFGVSFCTSLAAIVSELVWSRKASDKLIMSYYPFIGLGVLATIRGLIPNSPRKTNVSAARKKKV